jgi:hypothetical protein
LPEESALVAVARGSISAPRITTAMARGSVRGRVVLGGKLRHLQPETGEKAKGGKLKLAHLLLLLFQLEEEQGGAHRIQEEDQLIICSLVMMNTK